VVLISPFGFNKQLSSHIECAFGYEILIYSIMPIQFNLLQT